MRDNKIKLLLAVLIAVLYHHVSLAQSPIRLERADCFLADCSGFEEMDNVEFGYLTVPEDYTKPQGRQLKIAFAIIKSKVENPEPDAVMIFQGGWGSPILNSSLLGYAKGFPIKNRDVIMFDYRGSGLSQPTLCDWIGEETWNSMKDDLSFEEFNKGQTARFNQCLDTLESKEIDYNQYGSNTKSKDAVMLAEALGYDSYNLQGISYGTRFILNFIRNSEHSKVKIRSVILDSNSPMGMMTYGTMSVKYANVLNSIFNDCDQNPACKQQFPDLKNRFIEFLESMDDEPWEVPFKDGSSFTLSKEEMNAFMHQILYIENLYKYVPILIEHLIARDDNVTKIIIPSYKSRVHDNYNALGLINYVYDHKYFRDSTKANYNQYLAKRSPYQVWNGYIDFYLKDDRIATDSLEHIPIKSDIPALILAGSYDPITPPSYSKFTAESFSNSFYIEAPRFGHGVSTTQCGSSLITAFTDNPNEKPNNSCFESLGENPIPFKVEYYKNSRIGILLDKFRGFDLFLIASLLFMAIISIANTVMFFAVLIKKNKSRKLGLKITSALLLAFLIGLIIIIQKSLSSDPPLLLFGLLKSANYIFYLGMLILTLSLISIIGWIRNKEKSKWDIITLVSFALFAIIVFNYNLFPNF